MLENAKRAGVRMNLKALTRKFNFTVSPTTTSLINIDILVSLADVIGNLIDRKKFQPELSGVVFFPIITEPEIYCQSGFRIHKRASNGYFVGKNIPFDVWKKARFARRLVLASENFVASIQDIPDRHLSAESKASLIDIVQAAVKKVAEAH